MIDVKDLPVWLTQQGFKNAFGDGVNDDKPRLQPLIDSGISPLYFPKGRYRINSTLTFLNKTGYALYGSGLSSPVADQSGAKGAESVIVWGGTSTTDPMIEYQGVGLHWSGLGLWGCNLPGSSSSCPGTRAKYGIRLVKPSGKPVGTGKVWFDSILIANCDEAIATESPINANCDTLAFGYFWCADCLIALRLTHANSLQYTFQHVYAQDVRTIFQVDDKPTPDPGGGGGRIFTQVVSVQTDNTTVLNLKGGGANSGFHHLGGVTLKPGVTGIRLLDNRTGGTFGGGGGAHHVRFTDGHFADDDTAPTTSARIDVDRGIGSLTTLELVGCRGLKALAGRVKLIVHDSTGGTKIVFIVLDCEIDDVNTLIESGSGNYIPHSINNWTFASGA
jgi:hypothetical protein